jgi:N-acetylglucosaminyldiphosphoundecaprenol N-acetyl-beta-D-mannosaminyltransferase
LNEKKSLKVAICNTNTVVRSYRDEQLCSVINSFDIKTPDGFPIAKSSSVLYKNNQQRVDGYNVFLSTIREGVKKNTSHYFYGSEEHILQKLIERLKRDFPEINIVGSYHQLVVIRIWQIQNILMLFKNLNQILFGCH